MPDYKSQLFELDELMLGELNKFAQTKENRLPFVDVLDSLLAKFKDYVNSNQTDEQIATHLYDAPAVKRMVFDACAEIIKMLRAYQEGNILDAYKFVNRQFRLTGNRICASYHFPVFRISTSRNKWFRIRKKEDQTFSRKDLFHVPFDKRNKVGTYRFSIPGYPALYLGSTLYCSWLEMEQPKEFAFSIFDIQQDILVLDFRFFPDIEDEKQAVKYLLSYPFKIACSVVALDKKNYVPEYVFPQLMIHSILKQSHTQGGVIGLLYTSTKSFSFLDRLNCRNYDNLVVPAIMKKRDEEETLEDIFYLTEPKYVNVAELFSLDSFLQVQNNSDYNFQKNQNN